MMQRPENGLLGTLPKPEWRQTGSLCWGRTSWHEHMQAYNQIDIALDPFPHGGGVTALEGLMMGVPVITLRWPTVVGRLSASIMTTLGLTDWIAETQEEYVSACHAKGKRLAVPGRTSTATAGYFYFIGDRRSGRLCAGRGTGIPATVAGVVCVGRRLVNSS